ncbi:MAG: zincin-like metallopeptidase domain-containing protein, partial [Sphaerochaetaceae bacterium]|nr:zincin-like metallopeptidase domain-containing protein [Sphaerochaetaceae bacterium]
EFESPEEYYAALYHELVHSTGHVKRLGRFSDNVHAMFGSESYSEEELVAEIGASFLCGQAGILPQTLDNNAAYIRNWLEKIKGDKRIFVRSASAAQRAVDYITGEQSPFFLAMGFIP